MVTPLLGTLLALKWALNQINVPAGTEVPLKFEGLFADAVHGGGGGGAVGQLMVTGEKEIEMVLRPSNVAVPDGVKLPLNVPMVFVIGPLLKVEELATKLVESVMSGPRPEIVQLMVYVVPTDSSEAVSAMV